MLRQLHSALNGITEQVLFTNTVVQAFTALLKHLIPEQKTFSDHKTPVTTETEISQFTHRNRSVCPSVY